MIKGVIFDMDGVILDTEKLYIRFWCEAAQFYGYPMERRHALSIRSLARPYAKERLRGYFGEDFDYYAVHDKRIELMDAYIEQNGIEAKPGAAELLSCLKQRKIKTSLATATQSDRARDYLERVDLLKYFDEIVSASMVARGKPDPDIYLYAADRLGLSPEDCFAVEDSPNGIRSACAAGCKTIMVPDLDQPDAEILNMIFKKADTLTDIIPLLD